MEQFADLHCHPHLKIFNWSEYYKKRGNINPWCVIWSNIRKEKKGIRANTYNQSDLIKLTRGNVKLAFVSLYPVEKGWFKGKENISEDDLNGLFKLISKSKFLKFLLRTNKIKNLLLKIGDDKGKQRALRDILQSLFMKYPMQRINYIQSNKYNYFDELRKEKDFLGLKNNLYTESEILIPGIKRLFINKKKSEKEEGFNASGTYEIAKNGTNVKRIIQENKTAFVFTLEGANVFNTDENVSQIKERIFEVKNWQTLKHNRNGSEEESSPIFFISFAHHFYNYLCGHAHSIPDIGKIILDQEEGMNTGFNDKGKEIIRYLLSLNEDLIRDNENGRRILIDIKHMSAAARKFYYQEIIHPCNKLGDRIPIIASHVAYSGEKKLDELIENANQESDKDAESSINKPFNIWNINLCDEDINEIFESSGIIGISLDQRILGIPKKKKKRRYPDNYDIHFFWENLKAMMAAIFNNRQINNEIIERTHKIFGLGTDFDGCIDPLDKYPSSMEFRRFERDLIEEINNDPNSSSFLFISDVVKFVEGICFNNAYRFVIDNFH